MNFARLLYDAAWRLSGPATATASLFSPKLARAMAGRRGSVAHFRTWAIGRRTGPTRPALLLLHGASAGELAGAHPIVEALRRRLPDLALVVTYSSPSGELVAEEIRPDAYGFIPLDRSDHMGAFLDALRPSALVFAKLDVWPTLTGEAVERGIPVGLVNATVRPDSSRLRFPGRQLLAGAYRSLDAVGAVSGDQVERLVRLGVDPGVIRTIGDGSFDRALQRARQAGGRPPRLAPRTPGRTRLVAGSTWRADEAHLLQVLGARSDVELVLVPHEPTAEAVSRLSDLVISRTGAPPRLWSRDGGGAGDTGRCPPLVVDAVGFLAELYGEGDLAYVGGGLDGTGLHSVIEPAAAGRAVIYGGRHARWDARELVAAGGALEVDESASDWTAILGDSDRRAAMGRAARAYVLSRAGAAEAGADLITGLVAGG